MPDNGSTSDTRAFWEGIDQFNRGEFYACHDTLEAIWMTAPFTEKPFFQGILQLAVALYHLGNHNWRGAAILLGEGIRRLEPFEPSYHEVNVSDLLDCADLWLDALQKTGPNQVATLAGALSPRNTPGSDQAPTASLPQWEIHRIRPDDGMP